MDIVERMAMYQIVYEKIPRRKKFVRRNEKGNIMIKIKNLKLDRGQFCLEIKDLHIEKGDKIGIIGHNGAGKSTLIHCIIGEEKYSGTIIKNTDNIAVHLQFNDYFDIKIKYIIECVIGNCIKNDARIQELIEYFDFGKNLNKKYRKLSGGEKQRLTLILVLYQNGDVTILDEVTSGFDFETRNRLNKRLRDYLGKSNKTVLMVSHYYEELIGFVDKIMLLDHGKVIAFDTITSLFEKYIGSSVILFDEGQIDSTLLSKYKKIISKKGTEAYCLKNKQEEKELIHLLLDQNINFKKCNDDIEILTMNMLKGEKNVL